MTVKITKPEINIREKLTELDLQSGQVGKEVLKASTAEEAYSAMNVGRRNLIINGDFNVIQRDAYGASIGDGKYITDRWKTWNSGVTVDTNRSFVTFPDGTKGYTLTTTSTGNATGYIGLIQHVYDWNLYEGKTMTLSCWARTSIPTMNIFARNGTDRAFIPPDEEWHKVSLTFQQLGSSKSSTYSQFDFGFISYVTGSDLIRNGDYLEIGKVQLELGSVSTPFEHRLYAEELELCKRYYQIYKEDGNPVETGVGYFNTTTQAQILIPFSVEMRAEPTMSYSNIAHFDIEPFDEQPSSIVLASTSAPKMAVLTVVSPTARTVGDTAALLIDTAGGKMEFDAEQ